MALTKGSRRSRTPVVCSIGATDPTGGAGLFADALAFAQLGVRAVYVVAGVTAQNSARVDRVIALTPSDIEAQFRAVADQSAPDALRIGLVPSSAAIECVARLLRGMKRRPPVVLDPVLSSSSGRRFISGRQVAALKRLLRLVTIVTPNVAEAQTLSGLRIEDETGAARAAAAIEKAGCSVLVTGGHLRGKPVVDILAHRGRIVRFAHRRVGRDMRGTGCALAAALAANLARGDDVVSAIRAARAFVHRTLRHAQPLGHGKPQNAPSRESARRGRNIRGTAREESRPR
jgi:hydroxymethylpyrimidine kinase/phosphomethylpyrimidine kinase